MTPRTLTLLALLGLPQRNPFAQRGDELFESYTCIECGEQARTWAAFLAHRQTHHAGRVAQRRPRRTEVAA